MGSAVSVESAARIPHLGERPAALEAQGWSGRDAQWIALVCLHSGAFTRAQYAAFIGTEHWEPARRLVAALVAQERASEESWEDVGLGQTPAGDRRSRLCRIWSREVYRALEVEHIRHRRPATGAALVRRLLSLDYVANHLREPWLPTEGEKVDAFEALGISRNLLPRRDYHSETGVRRAHFPGKYPLALDDEQATTFVYPDGGDATASGLRTWGESHLSVWAALRELGRQVRVVVVSRAHRALARAERVLERWLRGGGDPRAAIAERERLETAIRTVDVEVLAEYGGVNGAVGRLSELRDRPEQATGDGCIDAGTTWFSRCLCAS